MDWFERFPESGGGLLETQFHQSSPSIKGIAPAGRVSSTHNVTLPGPTVEVGVFVGVLVGVNVLVGVGVLVGVFVALPTKHST